VNIKFNFDKRLEDLRKSFKRNKIDSYLINRRERIYYLTGYRGEDAYLLVTKNKLFLFTDSRYLEEIKDTLIPLRAQAGTSRKYKFESIISKDKIKRIKLLISKLNLRIVGFEENYVSYKLFVNLNKSLTRTKFQPSQQILDKLMIIKDEKEIKAVKEAIKITKKVFKFFKRIKKIGKTEKEIAQALEYYILQCGAERGGFDTMVISDERTASAHARSSNKKIKKDSNLIIDLGAKSYGYNSDLTRVCSLSRMSKRFKQIFEVVKAAQSEAIRAIKPNIKISTIDKIIRDFFKKHNLENYFIHASGHGIGLLVHEKPLIVQSNFNRLKKGMLFTIEPGIYLPGEFGIRLEDMVLVTEDKCKVLSNDIPKPI